jgi:hypothetical protein
MKPSSGHAQTHHKSMNQDYISYTLTMFGIMDTMSTGFEEKE